MITTQRITPCLWFADEGEEAARFYTGIFPTRGSPRSPATARRGSRRTTAPPGR
jgi:predicted 3-demethylubiquinone-9 3-methyltransferase (glyoxalase superfamily)